MPTPIPTATPDGGFRIFEVTLAGATVSLSVHPVLAVLLAALVFTIVVTIWRRSDRDRVVSITVDIPLGGIGRLTVNSDREVARLAQQAWIEIVTRKAGLPLDEENDVIEEVFNSWYELFRQLRQISKEVPPPSLRTKHARELVKTLVDALNRGLRPVLTRWQARYRVWLAAEQAKPTSKRYEPQDLQRRYPKYEEMMGDLRKVNADLQAFARALYLIAQRAEAEATKEDDQG